MAKDSQFREATLRAADEDTEIVKMANMFTKKIAGKRSKAFFSTEDAIEVIGALGAFLNEHYPLQKTNDVRSL